MSGTLGCFADVFRIILLCAIVCISTNFILLSFKPNLSILCNLNFFSNNIIKKLYNCKSTEKSLRLKYNNHFITNFYNSFPEIDHEVDGKFYIILI